MPKGLRSLASHPAQTSRSKPAPACAALQNPLPPSGEPQRSRRLSSPSFPETLQSLDVVFLLDPALDTKLRKNRHHLSQGEPGKLGSFAERCLTLLVSLNSEQNSPSSHQFPNGFGQITSFSFGDVPEKLVVVAVHSDAHGLAHGFASSLRLASSMI